MYSIISILKNLGIQEDSVKGDIDSGDINIRNNNYNEFSTFVDYVYKNCKKFDMVPAIIS